MTKDEALKIDNSDFNKYTKQELFEYIVVLREALEQPAQEPQYLYAYQNVFDGNCVLSIFSHKYNEQKPVGKIKLEVDDD